MTKVNTQRCSLVLLVGISMGIGETSFAQTLPSPVLSSPFNGSMNQPTTVGLAWQASFGASNYRVQVSTSVDFSALVFDSTGITGLSVNVRGLASGTTLYWRVRGQALVLQSDWSAVWSFATAGTIPGTVALNSPANGSTNQLTAPTLSWNFVAGADRYQLQVSTSSSFGVLVLNDSSITITSRQVASLNPATTYYWRVRAANTSGTGPWSVSWSLTTLVGSPPSPTLVSPADGATDQHLPLVFVWSPSSGAQTYRLQVSLVATFSPTAFDDSAITSSTMQVGGLDTNTVYFWRVQAKDSGGASVWSNTRRFATLTTPPATPALESPANGSSNVPTSLLLVWGGVQSAIRYHVQVSADASFSDLALNDTSVAATSRQAGPFSAGTRFYWRVRGVNSGGLGSWSSTWSFVIALAAPAPPSVPVLALPQQGVSNQPTTLRFMWFSSLRATSYQVQASTSPAFSALVVNTSGIVDTSLHVGPLADSTTYHWRARAVNDSGPSNWSASRSFTTASSQSGLLDAPDLLAPPNGATGQPTTVVLQWNAVLGATSYHLQVSRNSAFSPNVIDQSGVTSTSYTASGLPAGTSFFWRVRSSTVVITSDWSSVWGFSTLGAVPAAPTLTAPANNAMQSSTSVLLVWNSVGGTTLYQVQVAASASFSTLFLNDSSITASQYNVVGLDTDATYYWRVRARGASGWSQYSLVWTFLTRLSSSQPITLNNTTTFPERSGPSDFAATDYRIVGLPGSSGAPLQSFLVGTAGSDWQAYWDDGSPSSFLKPFNGDTTFRNLQGRAFWLIQNGPWTVNAIVPAPLLDSSYQAQIVIHPGWNLLTNPFVTSVPWSVIQHANVVSDPIFRFDGAFSISDSLDPYIGYYFYNSSGRSVLCIPTPGDRTGRPLLPTANTAVQGGSGWRMNVQLAAGAYPDKSMWLGVSPGALEGMDHHDYRKPRSVGKLSTVSFNRPSWDSVYSEFATDIRPDFNDLNEWQFTVKVASRTQVCLTFNGVSNIPHASRVYLIDDDRMVHVDLRGDSVYRFTPMTSTSTLRVVAGNEHSITTLLNSLMTPRSFVLEGNFPNPFNPSTVISFLVPSSDVIELRLYNVLGSELRTLFAGQLPAGRHSVEWNGTDERGVRASSGIYFCRLIGQNRVYGVHKMVLVK